MSLFGLLNLHKPQGCTSRRVVDLVARVARPAKVGHAGTLDPLATGVLVVGVGPATRLMEYVQQMPKQYRGEYWLGRSSPTEDTDGPITELIAPPIPTDDELRHAAATLVGQIEQRPPAYSALKVKGKRAYALARAGVEVELAPRIVRVDRLEVVEYHYPRLTLEVTCGGGTYVRTLGRSLAQACGTDAVMSALVRTAIGPFDLPSALDPEQLTRDTLANVLLSPVLALGNMPRILVEPEAISALLNGRPITAPNPLPSADELAALDTTGNLIAILKPTPTGLTPTRCFSSLPLPIPPRQQG